MTSDLTSEVIGGRYRKKRLFLRVCGLYSLYGWHPQIASAAVTASAASGGFNKIQITEFIVLSCGSIRPRCTVTVLDLGG